MPSKTATNPKAKSATAGYTKTARKDAKGRVVWKSKSGEDRVRSKSTSGASAGKLTWRKPASAAASKPKTKRGGGLKFVNISGVKAQTAVLNICMDDLRGFFREANPEDELSPISYVDHAEITTKLGVIQTEINAINTIMEAIKPNNNLEDNIYEIDQTETFPVNGKLVKVSDVEKIIDLVEQAVACQTENTANACFAPQSIRLYTRSLEGDLIDADQQILVSNVVKFLPDDYAGIVYRGTSKKVQTNEKTFHEFWAQLYNSKDKDKKETARQKLCELYNILGDLKLHCTYRIKEYNMCPE